MENKNKINFLGVIFQCCNVYGRLYKNKAGTHYVGKCPRGLKSVEVKIGENGTTERFFKVE